MTTNPAYTFYRTLHPLLFTKKFGTELAEQVLKLQSENPKTISLPKLDLRLLRLWHKSHLELGRFDETPDAWIRAVDLIPRHCFADLSRQFKNKGSVEVFDSFIRDMGIPYDTFFQIRKRVQIGDGIYAITVISNSRSLLPHARDLERVFVTEDPSVESVS